MLPRGSDCLFAGEGRQSINCFREEVRIVSSDALIQVIRVNHSRLRSWHALEVVEAFASLGELLRWRSQFLVVRDDNSLFSKVGARVTK